MPPPAVVRFTEGWIRSHRRMQKRRQRGRLLRGVASRKLAALVKQKSAKARGPRRIRRAASDMRAQALAAARRLIVEGSEEVLTMRAVADAAGVTYPHLSHHFGSAAGLHAAIAEDLVRELLAGLATVDVEMVNNKHDYRAIVDRVFDLFGRNGLGRVLGWLARISKVALIVAFAAYAESSVGALLGDVLVASPGKRREYFAQALAALRDG
jgi:AcrR family transcriptional regulator